MTLAGTHEFQAAQVRLARYYLDKLRTASTAFHRGQASVVYGVELFDRERGQIEHWQARSVERKAANRDWMQLCLRYPLAGLEVLSIRQSLPDQARWLEGGLDAALQLGDRRAELTILDKLSAVYGLLGDPEKEVYYAGKLLERGRETKDRLSIGRAYYNLGSVAEDRGSYAEALEHTERALKIFSELGARNDEGRALHHLGSIALYLGNFDLAHHYFSRHLELAESGGVMSEVCKGLLSVAQMLLVLEEAAQAEPYIRRAIRLSRGLGFQRLLGAGLIMLAQWHGEQNQIALEIKYITEGIAAARSVGSQRDVIHGLSNSGYARLLAGDLPAALSDLEEGLELAHQSSLPRFICNIQRNIADTYLALGDPESARPALVEALNLAREMGSSYQMVKAFTSAIGYWQLKGRDEQAAIWAGSIIDRRLEVDPNLFDPICARLETALGTEAYHRALEASRSLDFDQILSEVLAELS